MCTLTFLPQSEGYVVAMNRDERITRPAALPAAYRKHGRVQAIYPREDSGGTWIAGTDCGVTLALLNWNIKPVHSKLHSRGRIIPAIIGTPTPQAIQLQLELLNLSGTLPFRLIGVFPTQKSVYEWKWDQLTIQRTKHFWYRRHWFSSSASDAAAAEKRGAICEEALSTMSRATVQQVRELHSSHDNGPGAFSICVHRSTVESVSYSEVAWSERKLKLEYYPGSPCAVFPRSRPEHGLFELVTKTLLAHRTSGCSHEKAS